MFFWGLATVKTPNTMAIGLGGTNCIKTVQNIQLLTHIEIYEHVSKESSSLFISRWLKTMVSLNNVFLAISPQNGKDFRCKIRFSTILNEKILGFAPHCQREAPNPPKLGRNLWEFTGAFRLFCGYGLENSCFCSFCCCLTPKRPNETRPTTHGDLDMAWRTWRWSFRRTVNWNLHMLPSMSSRCCVRSAADPASAPC